MNEVNARYVAHFKSVEPLFVRGTDVNLVGLKMSDHSMSIEKQVVIELLIMYKNFHCLWDKDHVQYKNKIAREKAIGVLLEKWRTIFPNSTAMTLKKKLDNLRTTFLREWKTVEIGKLQAAASGSEVATYQPTLYYYDYMLFLKENETVDVTLEQLEEETNDVGLETLKLKLKRRTGLGKVHPVNDEYPPTQTDVAESFARTTLSQLLEMTNKQRSIAEQFIARIIYYGKTEQLTMDKTITLVDGKSTVTVPEDKVEELIEEVKKRECLWDSDNKQYFNRLLKMNAWKEIAKKFGVQEETVRAKWDSLYEKFTEEHNKYSLDDPDYYEGSWRHFKSLWFLVEGDSMLNRSRSKEEKEYLILDNESENRTSPEPDYDTRDAQIAEIDPLQDIQEIQTHPKRRKLDTDYEMLFFKSLTPYFENMSLSKKLKIRNKIQEILLREVCKE